MTQSEYQLNFNTDDDDKKYFVAFSYLQIKPLIKSKLFEYFDFDIKKAWCANKTELALFSEKTEIALPKNYFSLKDKINIEECYKEALIDKNIKILTYNDEKYPSLLKEIPDFPLCLYYKGDIESISYDYALAVVGSRNASTTAKLALNGIISAFKNSNITIVSGLAYGIDAQAHKSAIN